jgi:NADH-quinone oxidoreductase subunit M
MFEGYLLTWIVLIPLIGVPVVILLPSRLEALSSWITLALISLSGALVVYAWMVYDPAAPLSPYSSELRDLMFIERREWIPGFGIEYLVGVDGLSLPMLLLTVLISIVGIFATGDIDRKRAFFALYLVQYAGTIGVFVALDIFLFYVFWEITLLPMFFFIGIWGSGRREYAAIKFFLYTLFGSIFLLIALIGIYFFSDIDPSPDVVRHSFDIIALSVHNEFAADGLLPVGVSLALMKSIAWIFLFIAFAVKIPIIPLHTWLPDAHVCAPTPISVLLAALLLKMGLYGLIRISFGIFPEQTISLSPIFLGIAGTICILFASFVAFRQNDLKSMVAYSSIAHMGFALLGAGSMTREGISGAVYQMFSHGIISAMLFFSAGVLQKRAGHRDIDRFGGLASQLPIFATFTGVAFFAALAMPGFSGFIAEALCLLGSFQRFPYLTAIAATGILFTAVYLLHSYQRIFFGEASTAIHYDDLKPSEWVYFSIPALITITIGIYPAIILNPIGSTITRIYESLLTNLVR